ncbi:response regulator transcription factor [Alteromonas australica]|uniref:XRE family transcriptional regulator n=2 Tax=Alteromonas australica TaxID=589873 RepID=A0A075P970_9ALTE|nr:response regulator transcription factor [Alteromonas australica]AIF99852.1 XRE family transcriptional regulator [Alteromonas australica]
MRVLLVEDDPRVCADIEKGLISAGHECVSANDGSTGLALALSTNADVIILDIMLPLLDGFSVLEQLRSKKINTPVLLLSAKSEVDDKVKGLRTGANDYLTKPFAFEELLARAEGLGGRAQTSQDKTTIKVGDLTLDLVNRKVLRGETEIDLQSKEFQLLECLLRHKGKVVTRSMLLEQVWNYHFDPQTNVIDVHISRLRQKVDKVFNVPVIETVRGTGYRISDMLA